MIWMEELSYAFKVSYNSKLDRVTDIQKAGLKGKVTLKIKLSKTKGPKEKAWNQIRITREQSLGRLGKTGWVLGIFWLKK